VRVLQRDTHTHRPVERHQTARREENEIVIARIPFRFDCTSFHHQYESMDHNLHRVDFNREKKKM
jgi:hypothetical protein